MTDADRESLETRVLVLAPTGKDAELTRSILGRAGIVSVCCSDVEHVCEHLAAGAGAVLIAEEAVHGRDDCLAHWLGRQPPWSDLPVLVLARLGADSAAVAHAMDQFGNVTVLERPTRVAALVSAIRTALRARQRQYQIREHLAERLRAEEQARRSAELLSVLIDRSPSGFYIVDAHFRISHINADSQARAFRNVVPAIGRRLDEAMRILWPEPLATEIIAIFRHTLDTGEPYKSPGLVSPRHDLDAVETYEWQLDRITMPDGSHGVVCYYYDTTRLREAEQRLREADRRKDEFLAVLAHELRNPLAPIRNSLHILRMTAEHDPAAERVGEMMERQVNHMVRLVDDLMEVSRITRGKIELRKEFVELASVVRGAVETSRPLIDAAGHQLALAIPSEPLTVDGDPVRLTQVLGNLLNNAAKYTRPGGQIWLTVRREGERVAVSVRDTGAGIPPDLLPRVFDLFMQVDRDASRSQGGLGIGLALVKSLVEMHGGSVSAHSDGLGRGSEFLVHLPLAAAHSTASMNRTATEPSAVLATRRVLVVDDNRDAAQSLGMLLKLLGAEVQVVYNGADALETLAAYRPAVVLLDIGMPGMDGREVARRIRQHSEYDGITLIALTGWGQEEDRQRSQTAGFDYHLIKPADVNALQTLLMSIEGNASDRTKSEAG